MYITINLVEKVQGHDVQEYTNSHKNVEKHIYYYDLLLYVISLEMLYIPF